MNVWPWRPRDRRGRWRRGACLRAEEATRDRTERRQDSRVSNRLQKNLKLN